MCSDSLENYNFHITGFYSWSEQAQNLCIRGGVKLVDTLMDQNIIFQLTYRGADGPPYHVTYCFLPMFQVWAGNKIKGLEQPLVNGLNKVPGKKIYLQ